MRVRAPGKQSQLPCAAQALVWLKLFADSRRVILRDGLGDNDLESLICNFTGIVNHNRGELGFVDCYVSRTGHAARAHKQDEHLNLETNTVPGQCPGAPPLR